MVEVSCCTGLRRMEIVNMALGHDPDFIVRNYVTVTPAYSKNGKERSVPIVACSEAVERLIASIPEIVRSQDILPPLAASEGRAVPE